MLGVEALRSGARGLRAVCEERVTGAVRRFLKRDRRLRATEILSDCADELDTALDGPGDAWARLTRAAREGADAIAITIHLAEAAAEPERAEDLAKEIERLGPAELKLFDLKYRRGLSWREVGTGLGIGERAAKQRDKNLRDRLRVALGRRSNQPRGSA